MNETGRRQLTLVEEVEEVFSQTIAEIQAAWRVPDDGLEETTRSLLLQLAEFAQARIEAGDGAAVRCLVEVVFPGTGRIMQAGAGRLSGMALKLAHRRIASRCRSWLDQVLGGGSR